ncbi:distal tail protein Dit [Priestia flexa]|uniref:distal tail protein Dit n=1 Tax=Priestia flexa TaxID=86664 RepID=UPI003CFC8698
MNLTIKKQGINIDTAEYGLKLLTFEPSGVEHSHQTETIDGTDGLIRTNTTYGARELTATFFVKEDSYMLFQLLMDELNMLFATKEEVVLIDSRKPGKQWRAVVNSTLSIEKLNRTKGMFEIKFLSPRTYCESVGTTLDPFTFDADVWQIGMNLPSDRELIYKHNTNQFGIYNAGIHLEPKKRFPLRILFKGASNNLTIRNVTTGETFIYSGSTASGDTVLLDGIQHFKNSSNIFTYTNHKVISLMSGWNQFEITGTNGSFEIIFDFRFYYV